MGSATTGDEMVGSEVRYQTLPEDVEWTDVRLRRREERGPLLYGIVDPDVQAALLLPTPEPDGWLLRVAAASRHVELTLAVVAAGIWLYDLWLILPFLTSA